MNSGLAWYMHDDSYTLKRTEYFLTKLLTQDQLNCEYSESKTLTAAEEVDIVINTAVMCYLSGHFVSMKIFGHVVSLTSELVVLQQESWCRVIIKNLLIISEVHCSTTS